MGSSTLSTGCYTVDGKTQLGVGPSGRNCTWCVAGT